jgi:hypothetical protein
MAGKLASQLQSIQFNEVGEGDLFVVWDSSEQKLKSIPATELISNLQGQTGLQGPPGETGPAGPDKWFNILNRSNFAVSGNGDWVADKNTVQFDGNIVLTAICPQLRPQCNSFVIGLYYSAIASGTIISATFNFIDLTATANSVSSGGSGGTNASDSISLFNVSGGIEVYQNWEYTLTINVSGSITAPCYIREISVQ